MGKSRSIVFAAAGVLLLPLLSWLASGQVLPVTEPPPHIQEQAAPVKESSASQTPPAAAPALKPAPKKLKIVIDPGHGGSESWAVSIAKRLEKDFNLALGLKVYERLQQQSRVEVYLTRDSDIHLTPDERAEFANKLKADLFVSIHGNSFHNNASVHGVETYWRTPHSEELATIMHKHVVAATGFESRWLRRWGFIVVRKTEMPSVLLEIGYLSNEREEAEMFREEFQNRTADGIVKGILEFINRPS